MCPHLQRCRTIRVDYWGGSKHTHKDPITEYLLPLPGEMPRLEELRLQIILPPIPLIRVTEMSNQSPLNVLHLYGNTRFEISAISSSTIEDLRLGASTSENIGMLTRCSTSVKTLQLMDYIRPHIIQFPNLTRLAIPQVALRHLTRTTSCSNLKELVLYTSAHPTGLGQIQSIDPLPFEHLHSLTIDCMWQPDQFWTTVFKALPYVQHLICTTSTGFWTIVECLALDIEVVPELGLIRWVCFGVDLPDHASVDHVRRLLISRPQLRVEWGTRSMQHDDAGRLAALLETTKYDFLDRFFELPNSKRSDDLFGNAAID